MTTVGKKWDILVAGELNADIILNGIHSFPEIGKDIQADEFSFVLGSSSAIFASNIASLGARVAFCGVTGKDYFGDFVLGQLADRNIDTSMVTRTDKDHTGITFILNFDNDRASVTYHGTMALTTIEAIPIGGLKKARHFHLSSCFLLPGLLPRLPELFREAKESGLTTSLDPQWDPLERWNLDLEATLKYVDLFLPNEAEFLHLTKGSDLRSEMERACEGEGIIAVKQGIHGSSLYSKRTGYIHKKAYLNKEVADAIGAGDSYNAGFIFKYIQEAEPKDCQDFGNLTGALSTTKPGGTAAFNETEDIFLALEKYKRMAEK